MLCTHQRPELLTLCLVSLMTFSIYMNKFNFCTLLIPKGCPIIRGSEQPHSSRCLPQGFRTGRAEGSVKRFLLRDTTNPKVGSPSPLLSASPRGTFDVSDRHDPMIGAYVITGGALWKGGKGFCWMVESTAKLSCATDASFYNSESYELRLRSLLSIAKREEKNVIMIII